MEHGWELWQWRAYLSSNLGIAFFYFAFPWVFSEYLRLTLDAQTFHKLHKALVLVQTFVWWCGFHHLVMVPLMWNHGPLQFYMLLGVDICVLFASAYAVISIQRQKNGRDKN